MLEKAATHPKGSIFRNIFFNPISIISSEEERNIKKLEDGNLKKKILNKGEGKIGESCPHCQKGKMIFGNLGGVIEIYCSYCDSFRVASREEYKEYKIYKKNSKLD